MAQLTFRLPSFRNASSALAVALVVVSVLAALSPGLRALLVLDPSEVTGRFFAWQLLTWSLVATDPLGVIFGALITWSIGGALESMWGRTRLLRFCGGVMVSAAAVTVLLWLVLPGFLGGRFAGASALTAALWVAYGLVLGARQTNFWGIPMTGNVLALVGAGFVLLSAAFARSLAPFVPELLALGITFLWIRGYSPEGLWTRVRSWQLERELKRRSAHLRSVDGGRSGSRGSDKYLQ